MRTVEKLWHNLEIVIYQAANNKFAHKPFYKIYDNFVAKLPVPHHHCINEMRENEDNAHQ